MHLVASFQLALNILRVRLVGILTELAVQRDVLVDLSAVHGLLVAALVLVVGREVCQFPFALKRCGESSVADNASIFALYRAIS